MLELRRNLIYLGVLASIGYKCIVQGGFMKVMKGIWVVMKAKRFWNLYKHEGRTKIGHAIVASKGASDKGLKALVDHKFLLNLKYMNMNFCEHCVY